MTPLFILVGFLIVVSWGFAAATTRLAGKALTFWQALGILCTAKLVTRAADILCHDLDVWSRVGIRTSVYLVVLTIGLIVTAKIRPLVALGLALAFTTLLVGGMLLFAFAGVLNSPPPPAPTP